MRRSRLAAWMGISALVGMAAGCETMGRNSRRPVTEIIAGNTEASAPEGSRAQTTDSRSRGAWSSEAAGFEKNLMGRKVDPNW